MRNEEVRITNVPRDVVSHIKNYYADFIKKNNMIFTDKNLSGSEESVYYLIKKMRKDNEDDKSDSIYQWTNSIWSKFHWKT